YTRFGEVDAVVSKDNVLIFVEVKTRIGIQSGMPYEAVTAKKLSTIRKVGWLYLSATGTRYKNLRIDVISIVLNADYHVAKIEHFENVIL
ncbi:MAG TPA: YraN family protein, partial [Patescibacteria group bacterium]|nr:YraN family protein [Patescibacteria group bacterium]